MDFLLENTFDNTMATRTIVKLGLLALKYSDTIPESSDQSSDEKTMGENNNSISAVLKKVDWEKVIPSFEQLDRIINPYEENYEVDETFKTNN